MSEHLIAAQGWSIIIAKPFQIVINQILIALLTYLVDRVCVSQAANSRLHENKGSPSHESLNGLVPYVKIPVFHPFALIESIVLPDVRVPNRILLKFRVEGVQSGISKRDQVHESKA